ncbi:MAG: purine-binding chemotaxis protein CheW [Rhodospirillaceae bacterium]|jgi:purine-binding chemotaxis protein CheW|nr:purine-binding chemotaxis protein CheW [Rhodospirillaceae bacterium]
MNKQPGDEMPQLGGTSFDWSMAYRRLAEWRTSLSHGGNPSAEETARILRERARQLARLPDDAIGVETTELLVFALAGGRFGLRVAQIETVIPLQRATPVPCTPSVVHGLTNHHGEVVVVLDLRPYLGLDVPEEGIQRGIVVVTGSAGRKFGILGESLIGIESLETAKIIPMPAFLMDGKEGPLVGTTPDMVTLFDPEHLAHDPRLMVNEGFD